jgi:hypothetical protein
MDRREVAIDVVVLLRRHNTLIDRTGVIPFQPFIDTLQIGKQVH